MDHLFLNASAACIQKHTNVERRLCLRSCVRKNQFCVKSFVLRLHTKNKQLIILEAILYYMTTELPPDANDLTFAAEDADTQS
jgi:hypothetical protein